MRALRSGIDGSGDPEGLVRHRAELGAARSVAVDPAGAADKPVRIADAAPDRERAERNAKDRMAAYRMMATIRRVEEALLALFSQGKLNGTVHTCLGQEASAVGVGWALDRGRDVIFSNHRCHGHFLAYCDDVQGLMDEIVGTRFGVCAGVGGSQHLHRENFYSNGIQGGIVPLAVGAALAEKFKSTGAVSAVFLGDGTFGEGVVYEAMNVASLWDVPVLFVVEDNKYAQTTPSYLQIAGLLEARPRAFGIETVRTSGADVASVHDATSTLVARIRDDGRPGCLIVDTYRLGPHSKGDDLRPAAELQAYRARDPLARHRASLPASAVEAIDAAVEARVVAAVRTALEAAESVTRNPSTRLG